MLQPMDFVGGTVDRSWRAEVKKVPSCSHSRAHAIFFVVHPFQIRCPKD